MKHLSIVKNIADQQHGVIARHQLLDQGCPTSAIQRMVRSQLLCRIGRGVYKTFEMKDTWHHHATVAVFLFGNKSYLSHDSVLVYFGLLEPKRYVRSYGGTNYEARPIHVLTDHRITRNFHANIIAHESISITREDVYSPPIGLPHTSLARAFVDSTSSLSTTELDFALEKAFYKRLVTPQQIMAAIDRAPNGRGRQKRRLRAIVEPYPASSSASKATESSLEKRVQRAIERFTCYECHPQSEITLKGKRYRLDFAIPSHKVAIEVDGFEFHRNRMQFDNDRVRQNALISAGWKIVRITATFTDNQIGDAVISAVSASEIH